ncbi:hypothetical protein KM043_018480 [Ampulex compressa]|nr:hypothetical protein KM043_018480 [Ampulex compressa]
MKPLLRELFLLQVFLLCLLLSSGMAASTRSRGKKKVAKEAKEVNICDIEGETAPVYCYCDNSVIRNATDANCWVLSAFELDDPMWSYFTSQIYLQKLAFNVKPTGSLEYIPIQTLRQLKYLRTVIIQYAKIDKLVEHAFSNLSSISVINVSRNKIVVLRKYAFENMRNLTMINLDENRIAEINRDTFVNLPVLKSLFLNGNNISTLHDKAFKHLTSLEELQLSENRIGVITGDSFHGLRSLTKLDLCKNLISMIGDRTFIEMPNLQELELDQNEIKYITEKAFDGMRNLKKLKLSENKLVSLEPDHLAGAPGIYFLDLRDNALRTITFDNIKPIVTNLYNSTSHFYLDGQPTTVYGKKFWKVEEASGVICLTSGGGGWGVERSMDMQRRAEFVRPKRSAQAVPRFAGGNSREESVG